MSSTVTSDRANLRKRGTMLAYIFSNQGWGALGGCLVTMATLAAYKTAIENKGSKVDGGESIQLGK
jgi:PHS family inorganic phosphate transporter-like MFS transporter